MSFAAAGAGAYFTDACLPVTEALSVAVWVRPVYPETGYAPIFLLGSGGTDRCEFGLGPDNLYPVLSNGQTHSGSALYVNGLKALLPPGQWGHLALCADARGATTYVNGVPVVRSSYAGSFNFLSKDLRLGVRGAERYHGDLDGLRVWNRRLSDEEVAALAKP